MGLGAKQFPTYIHTLGQLGFLMLPLRHPTPPPPPVRGSACVGERGRGGGIRCINMNGRTSNGTTTIMATYTSTSGSAAAAAATVSAGCAGDDHDHEHERENDRFVYV